MSKIFYYIRDFYQTHLHLGYFVFILMMMAGFIYLNYWHGLDNKWIGQYYRNYKMFIGYSLLYFVIFFLAYFSYSLFTSDYSYWSKPVFIVLLVLAPVIFGFQQYFYLHRVWIEEQASANMRAYYGLSSEYIIRVILLIIPTFAIWWLLNRNDQPFYGFSANKEGYQPYWTMLLIMVPLIIFASTQKDFLQYYPKARIIEQTGATGLHKLWLTLKFEIAYGFNFITIESFFRGFLILAFVQYTGKAAIIPMACFYCSIHFGKPMMECISSFFGGLLLGIIAYHTRSIFGGLMVHLGIAWLMEAGALIGNYLKK